MTIYELHINVVKNYEESHVQIPLSLFCSLLTETRTKLRKVYSGQVPLLFRKMIT